MTRADETIFVGREEELQDLVEFARQAVSGKAGVAFVTGAAGSGKTALLEACLRRLRQADARVIVAAGRGKSGSASYFPFRALLADLLLSSSLEPPQRDLIREAARAAVQEIGAAGVNLFFPPPAAKLLGFDAPPEASDRLLRKDLEQVQLFGWYGQIIKTLARQCPFVLVLDDLHQADLSSLLLLRHLGRELTDAPVLLLAAYRPPETRPDSWLSHLKQAIAHLLPSGTPHPHEPAPEPLLAQIQTELAQRGAKVCALDVSLEPPEQQAKIARFVHACLLAKYGTHFSDEFEAFLIEISEGNPLFLLETLLDFEEKGRIKPRSDAQQDWELPTEFEFIRNFPETVADVINRRFMRLAAPLREFLECASAHGEVFRVEALSPDVQASYEETLAKLCAHRFLVAGADQTLPNGTCLHEYAFRHPAIREWIYGQLPADRKARIHADTGLRLEQLYEPDTAEIGAELAAHFYHGAVPEKAVSYCLQAAAGANCRYGTPEALHFGLMGLNAVETDGSTFTPEMAAAHKWRLLLELSKAEENGGDHQAQENHLRRGIAYLEQNLPVLHVTEEELYADAYRQLGKLQARQGVNRQEAQEYLEEALYIYEKHQRRKDAAEVLLLLGTLFPAGEAFALLERSCAMAAELRDVDLRIRCLQRLTEKYAECDFTLAENCARQAFQLLQDLRSTPLSLPVNGGRYAEERKVSSPRLRGDKGGWCVSPVLAAAEQPEPYLQIKVLTLMASICRENGKFQTGLGHLETSLEIARRLGDILLEAVLLNELGFDYGRFATFQDKARATLEQSLALRSRAGFDQSAPLYNLGWLFTRQGRWQEAETCFRKALNASGESDQAVYRGSIGSLYEFQEKYAQAEMELLYRLEVLEKSAPAPNLFGYTGIAVNYALEGHETQSRHYLEIAQTLFERETRPRKKWWGLFEIAEAYRMLKDYATAQTACQQAIEWFQNQAEDAENLIYLAEARLVMGKILVDLGQPQDALALIEKARAAFETCQHYALGETLFALGKAQQGLGESSRAKEYFTAALAEFRRLELHHKAREAQAALETLTP